MRTRRPGRDAWRPSGVAVALAALLSTVGCATLTGLGSRHVLYQGPEKPPAELAVVKCGGPYGDLRIHEIDGEPRKINCVAAYLRSHEIHLAPGEHRFLLEYGDRAGNYSTSKRLYTFDLEAGRQYTLRGSIQRGGTDWSADVY